MRSSWIGWPGAFLLVHVGSAILLLLVVANEGGTDIIFAPFMALFPYAFYVLYLAYLLSASWYWGMIYAVIPIIVATAIYRFLSHHLPWPESFILSSASSFVLSFVAFQYVTGPLIATHARMVPGTGKLLRLSDPEGIWNTALSDQKIEPYAVLISTDKCYFWSFRENSFELVPFNIAERSEYCNPSEMSRRTEMIALPDHLQP